MDIKIYEDQTGLMVFPENRSLKDDNIVKLFHNKVDLFIKKTGNTLGICCYMLAHKGLARDLGYYIIYTNFYSDTIFANFKKDTDKILRDLKLQISPNSPENTIFNNMEKFDPIPRAKLEYGYEHNTDAIKNAVSDGKHLEYITGNINEISIFCRDILKKINNVDIYVTSGESKLGSINISRKDHERLFYPSEITKNILNDYEKKLKSNKDKDNERLGKEKIAEGFSGPIKDGINIFKNIGHDPTGYVIDEMNKVIDINKIYNALADKMDLKSGDKNEKEGLGIISKIFIGFTILIIGIVIGMIGQQHYFANSGILKDIGFETATASPTVIATPTVTASPTVIATPTVTASPTVIVMTNGTTPIPINTPLTFLNSYPQDTIANSSINENITFSVTTNKIADITWRLNSVRLQYNQSVNTSNYTTTASVTGMSIVNVTANTVNETISKEWKWNITKGR